MDNTKVDSSSPQTKMDNSKQLFKLSLTGYQKPHWSAMPTIQYYFEVLKNGAIIDKIFLDKQECYLIGRSPDCDIVLDHPSISRHHAYLQHRDNGRVYIFDIGSTHGTYWNKKKIRPHRYVPVRLGDLLKFGQSTRMYILGSDDKRAQEIAEFQRQLQNKVLREQFNKKRKREETIKKKVKQEKKEEKEEEEEEEDEYVPFDDDDLKPKRIRIEEEFVDTSLFDEESDYFDRTGIKKQKKTEDSGVETTESLEQKILAINSEILSLEKRKKQLQDNLSKLKVDEQSDDTLEQFMSEMKKSLSEENTNTIDAQIAKLVEKREKLNRLLELSKPALEGLKTKEQQMKEYEMDLITADMFEIEKKPDHRRKPKTNDKLVQLDVKEEYKVKSLEIDKKEEKTEEEKIKEETKQEKSKQENIKQSKKTPEKVLGATYLADITEDEQPVYIDEKTGEEIQIQEEPKKEPQPEIKQNVEKPTVQEKKEEKKPITKEEKKPKEKKKTKKPPIPTWQQEELYSTWTPPEDQTGDGTTKLNEKFGY